LNLQLAGELDQQLLRAQQALFVADAACFQAVDQLVKPLLFGPIPGKRAVLNWLVGLGVKSARSTEKLSCVVMDGFLVGTAWL
jgi:hypothetical protein